MGVPGAVPRRALVIQPYPHCGPGICELQYSDDGQTFQTICRFTLEQKQDKTVSFEETRAMFFRLVITSSYPYHGEDAWNVQIGEITLQKKDEHRGADSERRDCPPRPWTWRGLLDPLGRPILRSALSAL